MQRKFYVNYSKMWEISMDLDYDYFIPVISK